MKFVTHEVGPVFLEPQTKKVFIECEAEFLQIFADQPLHLGTSLHIKTKLKKKLVLLSPNEIFFSQVKSLSSLVV